MFDLANFIKNGFIAAVGKMADYQIILNAAGWYDKGVLSETDLGEIQTAIDEKNARIEAERAAEAANGADSHRCGHRCADAAVICGEAAAKRREKRGGALVPVRYCALRGNKNDAAVAARVRTLLPEGGGALLPDGLSDQDLL